MPGDKNEVDIRDSLLSDAHGLAVLSIRNGIVQSLNAAAKALLDVDPTGQAVEQIFDAASAGKIHRIASAGTPAATELQIERPDAPPELIHFAAIPSAETLMLIGSRKGIHYPEEAGANLMAANEELARMIRELSRDARIAEASRDSLQRINSVRELFVAALAHDLRSPLSAVLLTETVLRRTAHAVSPADLEKHSLQVERNVRRVLELIEGLLVAARLDSADPELLTEPVSIDELAREWIEALAPIAENAGVGIEIAVTQDPPPVAGNRVRLGEVFSNLISNAVRHSPRGESVRVEIRTENDTILCEVSDRGPGIARGLQEKIFDKFVQAPGHSGSSGLGLYICRRVIDLHGGRIWVEDNHPTGARFVFCLPISRGK